MINHPHHHHPKISDYLLEEIKQSQQFPSLGREARGTISEHRQTFNGYLVRQLTQTISVEKNVPLAQKSLHARFI